MVTFELGGASKIRLIILIVFFSRFTEEFCLVHLLEAFSVNNVNADFLIFSLGNPHSLEGSQSTQG
jgi:hypothetical protein